mmetsp:Transcript_70104/g.194941  ORF Transcript_70104/g.194941 Transcript_70104/m.194941 type:complete len:356 (+) Transcript_70104:26-1093(+)
MLTQTVGGELPLACIPDCGTAADHRESSTEGKEALYGSEDQPEKQSRGTRFGACARYSCLFVLVCVLLRVEWAVWRLQAPASGSAREKRQLEKKLRAPARDGAPEYKQLERKLQALANKSAHGREQLRQTLLNLPEEALEGKSRRCLKYIHIPKTAGTSIMHLAAWSANDMDLTCSRPVVCPPRPKVCCAGPRAGSVCSRWHIPPSFDAVLANSYRACNTFCVVRHPVDRFISEYLYRMRNTKLDCSMKRFNIYVHNTLEAYKANPWLGDCHFVPQAAYVYGSPDRPRRFCTHVLQFESLADDFSALMRAYGLPLNLSGTHANPSKRCKAFAPSPRLLAEIRKAYSVDFEALGYT